MPTEEFSEDARSGSPLALPALAIVGLLLGGGILLGGFQFIAGETPEAVVVDEAPKYSLAVASSLARARTEEHSS